ncbi:MAG: nucleoside triphosphate pyrophosphohydrolase [Chloroflexi bacterium]|nr:nucleoside triphosphate pyrophosphohydrolase [Chloroflexota bacterium]
MLTSVLQYTVPIQGKEQRALTQPPKELHTFQALQELVARLRAPGGCPWDREQTHSSLRRSLLEECYEAIEAMDEGDAQRLAEELGDILLQIAFHCQIAEEQGQFTYGDVFRRLNEKLVRRHPHVFGNVQVRDAREVEVNWEAIKREERGDTSLLGGAPRSMPALAYCQAISHRAARAGFEWEDLQGVLAKVAEELRELEEAQGQEERERELGDVLFSLVNVARWLGVDAESALRRANERFYRRFVHMEQTCRQRGVSFTALSMAEKEALWQQAKGAVG